MVGLQGEMYHPKSMCLRFHDRQNEMLQQSFRPNESLIFEINMTWNMLVHFHAAPVSYTFGMDPFAT